MKIIIVGLGKVGYAIAQQMVGEEHDLILVDESAAVIEHADATLDAMCVEGNGACASVLLRAGVRDADLVIAATPIDLTRVLKIKRPAVRVGYELQEIGSPTLDDVLAKFK